MTELKLVSPKICVKASSILPLVVLVLVFSGCSNSGEPSAEKEMANATEIFLGDGEQFGVSVQEGTGGGVATEFPKSSASGDSTDSAEPSAPGQSPDAPVQEKKKPRPKPLDVDAILTKSKKISVGLISDAPQSRLANEAKSFTPASVTKIVTTASALKRFGRDFRFKTTLSFKRDGARITDLIIVADGDPTVGSGEDRVTTGSARFREIAVQFRKMGIAEVGGAVTLLSVDPRLDRQQIAEGVPLEDIRECYGAVALAFNFGGNCTSVRIRTKPNLVGEESDRQSAVNAQVETVAGKQNSTRLKPILAEDRTLTGYQILGSYSEKRPQVLAWQLPTTSSAILFGQKFLHELRASKIAVEVSDRSVLHAVGDANRIRVQEQLRDPSRISMDFESTSLGKIVEHTNKVSDNFLADSLFRAIGIRNQDRGLDILVASGRAIAVDVQEWVSGDGNAVFAKEIELNDGNGLSTKNRMTPRALLSVLRQLRKAPYFNDLLESLPIAGRDGTLGGRMRGSSAEGVVFAKTGTLRGSYQLAGYIRSLERTGEGEFVPFVILTDTTESNRSMARSFQDIVVAKLAAAVRKRR